MQKAFLMFRTVFIVSILFFNYRINTHASGVWGWRE